MTSINIAGDMSLIQILGSDTQDLIDGMDSSMFTATIVDQFYQLVASHTAMRFLLHIAQDHLLLINLMMWEWLEGVIKESSQNVAHWLHSLCLQAEIISTTNYHGASHEQLYS
jgi:hypothetical protein